MRKTYKIKSGDTLGAIARRLGTTVKKLAEMNGITDVNRIRAGAALKLPTEARQKWMSIQAKESGATLSSKRKPAATTSAVEERQRAYKALSDSSKAMGGSGAVLSQKAKGTTKSKPMTLPVSPPKGRKTKKQERLVTTIDPKTGNVVDKKVTEAQHLANLDEAKRRGLSIGSQKTKAERAKSAKELESKIKALVGKRMAKGGYANCGASVSPAQKSSRIK